MKTHTYTPMKLRCCMKLIIRVDSTCHYTSDVAHVRRMHARTPFRFNIVNLSKWLSYYRKVCRPCPTCNATCIRPPSSSYLHIYSDPLLRLTLGYAACTFLGSKVQEERHWMDQVGTNLWTAYILVENVALLEYIFDIRFLSNTIAATITAVICSPTDRTQMWRSLVVLQKSLAKFLATVCWHGKSRCRLADWLND